MLEANCRRGGLLMSVQSRSRLSVRWRTVAMVGMLDSKRRVAIFGCSGRAEQAQRYDYAHWCMRAQISMS